MPKLPLLKQIPRPTPEDVVLTYRLRQYSEGKIRGMYTRILSRTCEQWPEVIGEAVMEFEERGLIQECKKFVTVFRYSNTYELTKRKLGL